MRVFTSLIMAMLFAVHAFAYQGQYLRKSISSVQSVWIKKNAVQNVDIDRGFLDKMLEFYIEVDRFDYNSLPQSVIEAFLDQAASLDEYSPASIAKVLENTVVKEITNILNDPEIMKKRGLANKDESAFQTFAATKGQSFGLNAEELRTLMNSAYIYLPFIDTFKGSIDSKNNIIVKIHGGVIWYHVITNEDGSVSLEQVVAAKSTGLGKATAGKSYTFCFGKMKKNVDAATKAQYDAVLAWAKNIGVKTKKIDDFKLSAQIAEASENQYSLPLGHREGVLLDDGFDIVENVENKDGELSLEKIGFIRIIKTANNIENPEEYSYAVQFLGEPASVGSVVMERPRLGMDMRVKGSYAIGINIPKDETIINDEPVLQNDANSAMNINTVFSYDIAPIIGITQTFVDLDLEYGMPIASINPDAKAYTYIFSSYLGASKKFFFGRSNLTANIDFGYDMFNMKAKINTCDFKYSLSSLGAKAGIAYEFMLNPDLSVNFGAGYKFALKPMRLAEEVNGTKITYTGADIESDINLGCLNFNIGINYALGELPINIFGFLDPFKKY